ncbi:hypothetical protein [Asanoa siamensis]|uniref:DUF11 domain-containing protein n=1 Tax=Asanoa siamensis TaxID=926357 RepID=A0ABQ4CHA1_9ACTN|nr:hypothetical protein [Asanoa siamensis]GIF70674.1 hypothetical protein Asi02nite_01920 [Asanoa siamensis]
MPSDRRTPALLRALAAGLLAAGLTALVVAVPSMGPGPGPVAVAYDPEDDTTLPDPDATEPDSPPTIAAPTETATETPSPTPTDTETGTPTEQPTTEPTRPSQPSYRPGPSGVPYPTQSRPGPVLPGDKPRLAALVRTDDVSLGPSYWTRGSTRADLRVVVENTGTIVERISMRYTLPEGLTDAGTPGCQRAAGRTYTCGSWVAGPGKRFSTTVRVRVAGDAWRRMPLSGSVDVTASAPGRTDLGTVGDNQGFAVLFPPGPPVAGIRLAAGEVDFRTATGTADLDVRLTNSGDVDSAGAVEVVLPEGVTVGTRPAGCATEGDRTRCDLGRLGSGETVTTTLPLLATAEAQRLAPLSGAVFGTLTAGGRTKQVQMSFRITAAAATATPSATPDAPVGPTASQGMVGAFAPIGGDAGGLSTVQKTALALVIVSILLVVLAIALATTSLRARIEDDSTAPLDVPAHN